MKKRLNELKDEEPNMEQTQRMKRAAQDWHKQRGGNVLDNLLSGLPSMNGGKRRRSSKKSQKRKSSKRKLRR